VELTAGVDLKRTQSVRIGCDDDSGTGRHARRPEPETWRSSVNDVATVLQIVVVLAAFVAPIIVILTVIAGDEPVDVTDLFATAEELPWPPGVQEEDVRPWDVGRLQPRESRSGFNAETRPRGS
jgi:hypothetical protein